MSIILVVDDEPPILQTLSVNLRARGYEVLLAPSGRVALETARSGHPDVVVLDLGLPDMEGIDVIHGLREHSEVPIVVLSARRDEAQKIAALDAGANDYVSKPFGMGELMARLRVALRPAGGGDTLIETPDFSIDLSAKQIRRGGKDVRLTATEWRLVELLARNPGRLISQQELIEKVWGLSGVKTNYVRVFMVAIRRKLEPEPTHPRYFVTEPGSGLRFVPEGLDADQPADP